MSSNSIPGEPIQATDLAPLTFGAIGDAYGFCFEFAPPEFVQQNNDLRYHRHPKFRSNRPGNYSDDTQMQIAIAELMVSQQEWTPLNVAEHFVDAFKRDRRAGYARGFHGFLKKVRDGKDFLANIKPTSDRNGACMRAPVIGLLPDLTTVKHHATVQARVTHDTAGGIDSAVAAALMSHFFAYQIGDKRELPSFLNRHVPGCEWTPNWTDKVLVHGISTVQAALTAIVTCSSLSEILYRSIAFTGDVDSVATIACACASNSQQFTRDIPIELWNGLEASQKKSLFSIGSAQPKFGLKYLRDLDQRLATQCFSNS